MSRFVVVVLVVALVVGCGPAVAPAPLVSAPPASAAWPAAVAESNLRMALARRGHLLEAADDAVVAVSFDRSRAIVRLDGGQTETVVSGGVWLVATPAGSFWVFEEGVIQAADEEAGRLL
jgi:hypothetical protein